MFAKISKKVNCRRLWVLVVGICVLAGLPVLRAKSEQPAAAQIQERIEALLSDEARVRDETVWAILGERKDMVRKLIELVDPANAEKYCDKTRIAAAFLLGEFRAREAVPVLSKALRKPLGPGVGLDASLYSQSIFGALVKIGRPAVPAMIENVEGSDDEMLRKRSLGVLSRVLGGKRRTLELLAKLQARAKDEKKIERIKAAIKYTQEHFKENQEPLY